MRLTACELIVFMLSRVALLSTVSMFSAARLSTSPLLLWNFSGYETHKSTSSVSATCLISMASVLMSITSFAIYVDMSMSMIMTPESWNALLPVCDKLKKAWIS